MLERAAAPCRPPGRHPGGGRLPRLHQPVARQPPGAGAEGPRPQGRPPHRLAAAAAPDRPSSTTPPPTSPTCSSSTTCSWAGGRGAGTATDGCSTRARSCAPSRAAPAIPRRRGAGSRSYATSGARPWPWPRPSPVAGAPCGGDRPDAPVRAVRPRGGVGGRGGAHHRRGAAVVRGVDGRVLKGGMGDDLLEVIAGATGPSPTGLRPDSARAADRTCVPPCRSCRRGSASGPATWSSRPRCSPRGPTSRTCCGACPTPASPRGGGPSSWASRSARLVEGEATLAFEPGRAWGRRRGGADRHRLRTRDRQPVRSRRSDRQDPGLVRAQRGRPRSPVPGSAGAAQPRRPAPSRRPATATSRSVKLMPDLHGGPSASPGAVAQRRPDDAIGRVEQLAGAAVQRRQRRGGGPGGGGSARAWTPGRRSGRPRCALPRRAAKGSHARPRRPAVVGSVVHGSGRPAAVAAPGSTTRSAGTSASSRPSSSPANRNGVPRSVSSEHGGRPGPVLAAVAGAVTGHVVVGQHPRRASRRTRLVELDGAADLVRSTSRPSTGRAGRGC